jgi:hypothetical protein
MRERHNERKNDSYNNPDIVLERSRFNIHYYESIEKINARADQVSRIGQAMSDGSYLLTERQHMALTNMAIDIKQWHIKLMF